MGCDIHLYREKKLDGVWVSADTWTNAYNEGLDVDYDDRAYTGRNYDLFGLLAGVRGDIPGHFEARCMPDDCCAEIAAVAERWGCDGHSHSYLNLSELQATAERLKVSPVPISGMMHKDQLARLHASIAAGEPDWDLLYPYCQGTTSPDYVSFSVDVPGDYVIGGCLQKIINSLEGIGGDDQRIVFFFDN